MPAKPDAAHDQLRLYVHLSSSRGAAMPAQAVREQFGSGVDQLLEIGAAQPGRPLSILKCPACYEDHTAEVEYDAESCRSWIFCPEGGRVWVDDAALATLHLNTNWLPDQLARSLNISPKPPRVTVIKDAAWLLGDTVVGSTKVSVAVVIGIRGAGEIDQLIAGLGRRKLLDAGLLFVAGSQIPEYVNAASKYATVSLDELASFENGAIYIEQARLGAWVRGLGRGSGRPIKSRGGRLSTEAQVLTLFNARRNRGEPFVSKLSEARAIQSDWSSLYADEAAPVLSTIRSHLPAAGQF